MGDMRETRDLLHRAVVKVNEGVWSARAIIEKAVNEAKKNIVKMEAKLKV
jgi:hypothetical protein